MKERIKIKKVKKEKTHRLRHKGSQETNPLRACRCGPVKGSGED
jgi:hypothetical protein